MVVVGQDIELPRVYYDPELEPGHVAIMERKRSGWCHDVTRNGEVVMAISIPPSEVDMSRMKETGPDALGVWRERVETMWAEIKAANQASVDEHICVFNFGERSVYAN